MAYARALAEVLGHPTLTAMRDEYSDKPMYEPEATPPRMHVALQFEHTDTSEGWIFEVPPGDPAREFFAALEAGTVSATTEYRLQDDALLLVAVHAHPNLVRNPPPVLAYRQFDEGHTRMRKTNTMAIHKAVLPLLALVLLAAAEPVRSQQPEDPKEPREKADAPAPPAWDWWKQPEDLDELRKMAEQGDAYAQNRLGVRYSDGDGVPQDDEQAVHWYLLAAEQGFTVAQQNLGEMYREGRGVPRDDEQAKYWFRRSYLSNPLKYADEAGRRYAFGHDSVPELRARAEQGDAKAQFELGARYSAGHRAPQDDEEALRWYYLAGARGHDRAQLRLGDAYQNGRIVPRDYALAVGWYRLAAEQGQAQAEGRLGLMYASGLGVAQDDGEARHWFQRAASGGDMHAQHYLGDMFREGRVVPKDMEQALKWYRRSAKQGDLTGQNSLGDMYRDGLGVPQNPVRAYAWYSVAAQQGHQDAQRNRDALGQKLTAQQRTEAQALDVRQLLNTE